MAKDKGKKSPVSKVPSKPLQIAKPDEIPDDVGDDVTPIVNFLAAFRQLADPRAQHPSKLISLKVPEPLLAAFKFKAGHSGVPYQTMIKRLMMEWLQKA